MRRNAHIELKAGHYISEVEPIFKRIAALAPVGESVAMLQWVRGELLLEYADFIKKYPGYGHIIFSAEWLFLQPGRG
jgi:hypothetical protein